MKSSRPLLVVSLAASLIFLLVSPQAIGGFPVVLKVASVALLAVLGFRVNKLLGTALALGALGDFLLGVNRLGSLDAEKLFLAGLGAFLVGHLVYIAMFRGYRGPSNSWTQPKPSPRQTRLAWSTRALGIAAVLIALAAVLGVLRNSLGPLLIPVVVYALVLAGMAISAQLAELGNPLAAVGALFFVASDAMLAIAKFRQPFLGSATLIWIAYYLAQFLILLGVGRGVTRRNADLD
ncbi:MAG TPA: lysoplasmalogenase [Candidatus Eisenbacteria bacterium]|nr:lysoplasmalogenase [Candidatus Eisenbacteria bacterium]